MVRQQIILVIIMLVLVAPFVSASAFSTAFSAIDNEILPNETATFELQISNFGATQARFQVYTIDPNWVSKVDPVSVRVPPGTSETFVISLKPKSSVAFGSQGITINVKDLETNDLVRKNLFVAVKSYDAASGTFQPSVAFDVGMPQVVDPRNLVALTVNLRNRNALDIADMVLTLKSPHYSYETTLDLPPLAEDSQYLSMNLDAQEAPGEYILDGALLYRGAIITKVQRSYRVGEFASVEESRTEQSFLLKQTTTITLTNDGNVAKTITVSSAASLIDRLFSGLSHDATYNQGQYVWSIDVPAGETVVVVHSQNYRYFFAAIVLILVGIVLYFRYRSPLVIVKEAVGTVKGEGMSDLRVRVFVKNRSNKVIQGVDVLDKVPRIAEVDKTHDVGTLKPNSVRKTKSGAVLQWNLDVLEPYEERILTYTLKSTLKIIGKVSMPEAKVKFETDNGQERVAYSNNILVVEGKS